MLGRIIGEHISIETALGPELGSIKAAPTGAGRHEPGREFARLLQVLYTVRSERMLMEQLEYNLLFR
jgi:hypothetical protein